MLIFIKLTIADCGDDYVDVAFDFGCYIPGCEVALPPVHVSFYGLDRPLPETDEVFDLEDDYCDQRYTAAQGFIQLIRTGTGWISEIPENGADVYPTIERKGARVRIGCSTGGAGGPLGLSGAPVVSFDDADGGNLAVIRAAARALADNEHCPANLAAWIRRALG